MIDFFTFGNINKCYNNSFNRFITAFDQFWGRLAHNWKIEQLQLILDAICGPRLLYVLEMYIQKGNFRWIIRFIEKKSSIITFFHYDSKKYYFYNRQRSTYGNELLNATEKIQIAYQNNVILMVGLVYTNIMGR